MVKRTIFLACALLLISGLVSCTSEYERCLEEAKELRNHLSLIENRYYMEPSPELRSEIESIEMQIRSLAKISGHEDLFLSELSLVSIGTTSAIQ